MRVTRREWLGVSAFSAAQAAQQLKPKKPRPMLCLFSKHLQKLDYTELGPVLKQLGFEGCDLTVRAGGHVLPEKAQVDLLRAIESLRGEGVEVPMITTDIVTANAYTSLAVLAIAGQLGVHYFKPGYWRYKPGEDIEARLAEVRRESAGLVALGKRFGIAAGFHNHSGDYVGQAIWDTRAIIADLDPRWSGYYYDPCHATAEGGVAGWRIALAMALPRLKMVALKDFYWIKSDGKWKTKICPLGEGMVDWPRFFSMLAAGRFTGPISLHIEYNPADEIGATAKDLEFAKKQLEAAYA